jgi:hypothetical protein
MSMLKNLLLAVLLALGAASLSHGAAAAGACPPDSYSAVLAPDSSALSILFDAFAADSASPRPSCSLHIPLELPAGQSLGVYRVDYRGFAHLSGKGFADLSVDYTFGANKTRSFARKVKGPTDQDFAFTENIGAGLMKRIGCGEQAALDITVGLALPASAAADDQATLDSGDGTAKRGLVYRFDLKPCR